MRKAQNIFSFFIVCFFLMMINGCSTRNYRGEGALAGGAIGGTAAYFGGHGNPAIGIAGAAGGALIGGAIGMFIPKDHDEEYRLSVEEKRIKLYEECLRIVEMDTDEVALNRRNIYGGSTAYYAPPRKLGICQRHFPELFEPDQEGEEE